MKTTKLLALLLVGIIVISAGCIGGGGGTSTASSHSPTGSSTTASTSKATGTTTTSVTATTTTTTTTTETQTTGPVSISLSQLSDYVGKNVSLQASLEGIGYDSTGHFYVLSVSGDGVTANVTAGRRVVESLNPLEAGTGSTIKVIGTVEDGNTVRAQNISVITPVKPEVSEISSLSKDELGKIVVIKGNIESTKEIGSNLKLTVSDGTGEIAIFIPGSVVAELPNETMAGLKKGLGVEIGGYLDEYKGSLEIIPFTGLGIKAYGEPLEIGTTTTSTTTTSTTSTTSTSAPEITNTTLAGLSSVSGKAGVKATWVLLSYQSSTHSYVMLLNDSSGEANITVQRDLLPNPIEAGTGSELYLIVDPSSMTAINVTVTNPAPSPLIETANITEDLMGKTVVIEGQIDGFKTIGNNFKFLVVDGSGNVTVFIPSSVTADLPSDVKSALTDGAQVKIGGYVTEYKGTIEVVPYVAEGIIVEG
jgi:DNA/RNA endonuclease YhcR with UshA esterase domain